MPIEIKDKRTKKVQACAVAGNTINCGHCNQPIVDQTRWFALDDPYFCLVHETCFTFFKYDEQNRMARGQGRADACKEMDWILKTLHDMTSRPWYQNTKYISDERKRALQQLLLIHQSLRTSSVISDRIMDSVSSDLAGMDGESWFQTVPKEKQQLLKALLLKYEEQRNKTPKMQVLEESVPLNDISAPKPFIAAVKPIAEAK